MRFSLSAAALGLLLAAPAAAQVLPGGHHLSNNDVTGYLAQERMQAMALTGRWVAAFTKDDTERLVALYTKDAVMLGSDGGVARTRKAIQESLQQVAPRIADVEMTVDDFDLSGEMIYIAGRFTYGMLQQGGGILRESGPFSMILRRDFTTSEWRIRSHITPGPLVAAEEGASAMISPGPSVVPTPLPSLRELQADSALAATTELLRQAAGHYERARAAQRIDDWTTYGTEMQRLGEILRKVDSGRGSR